MMAESKNTKKNTKGLISEDDVSLVLERYDAQTILTVLKEVAQFPDVEIDWNALVKKTSTGISNAREYQMLWRHLAYRDTLAEKVEETEPSDDESDLEYELEAFPPVSDEASVEAAAFVKVLLASSLPDVSGPLNRATVEAPLTINIPNGQASRDPSNNPKPSCSNGTNITVSVSVQKQPLPTVTTAEGLDGSGSATGNAKRKTGRWTEEEDRELIAAVEEFGERNWTKILKGGFKVKRNASQCSQRWSVIKKQQANSNPGGVSNPTVPQLTKTQLATGNTFSRAFAMPGCILPAIGVTNSVAPAIPAAFTDAEAISVAPSKENAKSTVSNNISHGYQYAPLQTATSLPKEKANTNIATADSRVPPKKASSIPVKSPMRPNPMVQAAAVAAGARIVTYSSAVAMAPNHSIPRPNVHYIRTSVLLPGATNSVTPAVPPTDAAVVHAAPSEAKPSISGSALHQDQQAPLQTATSLPKATPNAATAKSRVPPKKSSVPVKSPVGPNPMIQAAAVAAGARIVTPSSAKTMLKTAQPKNTVHIRPGGNPLVKPAMPGGTKTVAPNHSVPRPNVHYIRTGLTSALPPVPASTDSTVVPSIPPPPAVTPSVPSVSASTSASCGTSAEGKITSAIKTAGAGNSFK